MFVGFANEGQLRELESPSVKLSETSKHPVAMRRSEVLESKIDYVEANLKKLNRIKSTNDTKEMLQASIELHEFILPVYKREYKQLAKLYDEGASKESIQEQANVIHDKYSTRFEELYNKLITIGKSFAERHNIKVNWAT
jgi:TRAP-type mannitol/chloroaromatic compound transport system substrate-binding protein